MRSNLFPFIVIGLLLFGTEALQADELSKEDVQLIIDSVHRVERDNVKRFLTNEFGNGAGLSRSVNRFLAMSTINSIDVKLRNKLREPLFQVFERIALDETRERDQSYAFNTLCSLATKNSKMKKRLIPIAEKLAGQGIGGLSLHARRVARRLKNPREIVEEVNQAIVRKDFDAALKHFHHLRERDEERVREQLKERSGLGDVVKAREFGEAALIIVDADDDRVCLILTDSGWRICQHISEFTVPELPLPQTKSTVGYMKDLHSWADKQDKALPENSE